MVGMSSSFVTPVGFNVFVHGLLIHGQIFFNACANCPTSFTNINFLHNYKHCNKVYIGETGRTIGTRIKEHLTMNKQTMYKNIESHRSNEDDMPTITWRILHSNINNDDERKCIEAFEIKKRAGNIINGVLVEQLTFKIYILHDTPA
jgi:hypothetical protein